MIRSQNNVLLLYRFACILWMLLLLWRIDSVRSTTTRSSSSNSFDYRPPNLPTRPTQHYFGNPDHWRAATITAARTFMDEASQRSGLLRAIPALQRIRRRPPRRSDGTDDDDSNYTKDINPLAVTRQVVSIKTKAIQQKLIELAAPPPESTGFYYGVSPKMVKTHTTPYKTKPLAMKEAVSLTLEELRTMRLEMQALRDEIRALKRNILGDEEEETADPEALLAQKRKRQREFDRIGREVERWAEHLLFEQDGEVEGWKEVQCNKVLQSSLNPDGRTRAFLKWMKDSRGSHANPEDDREYPCIKVYSTIDAPLEVVCQYLSDEHKLTEYNDLVVQHKDLEDIAPHSKIAWGQTPAILFIQPRDLITFCHHRWLRDGTQVIVNQACDSHEGFTPQNPQAYALRGANFLSRHPDDPEKTRIAILAHANPGPDIPHWASKTAVKALVPIEPFKLFQRINKGVAEHRQELEQALPAEAEMVSEQRGGGEGGGGGGGRSTRPAGIAQLGYACFWPQGGGLQDDSSSSLSSKLSSLPLGMDKDSHNQASADDDIDDGFFKPNENNMSTE